MFSDSWYVLVFINDASVMSADIWGAFYILVDFEIDASRLTESLLKRKVDDEDGVVYSRENKKRLP